jgi:uncharacterized protein YbjT (DUF2867 family)
MRVLLFGATGMVGQAVLRECLADTRVSEVFSVARGGSGVAHAKFRELLRKDLFDLSGWEAELSGFDACFFCLGVSSAGKSDDEYRRLTYDLTTGVARFLLPRNPALCFVYVSGQGTDGTEKGRIAWARVKGATENAILGMGFRDAYAFRPGMIRPMHGEVTKTPAYRWAYFVLGPALPLLRKLMPGMVTTTEEVGRAMLRVAREGWPKKVLESRDIVECGG